MFERIPKELKENALFCLYKLEQRGGKQTKVPYQVRGARADPSNPKCFTNFNTVERAYKKGGYAGLGVGVFEPYVMIDIDHCVTNGKLSDMAKKIVGIMDSYTEYSPSGTGVHITRFEEQNLTPWRECQSKWEISIQVSYRWQTTFCL